MAIVKNVSGVNSNQEMPEDLLNEEAEVRPARTRAFTESVLPVNSINEVETVKTESVATESSPLQEETVAAEEPTVETGGDSGSGDSEDTSDLGDSMEPAGPVTPDESEEARLKRERSLEQANQFGQAIDVMLQNHAAKKKKEAELIAKTRSNGKGGVDIRLPQFRSDTVERDLKSVRKNIKKFIRDNKDGVALNSANIKTIEGLKKGLHRLGTNPDFNAKLKDEANKEMAENFKEGLSNMTQSIQEAFPQLKEAMERLAKIIESVINRITGKSNSSQQGSTQTQS